MVEKIKNFRLSLILNGVRALGGGLHTLTQFFWECHPPFPWGGVCKTKSGKPQMGGVPQQASVLKNVEREDEELWPFY